MLWVGAAGAGAGEVTTARSSLSPAASFLLGRASYESESAPSWSPPSSDSKRNPASGWGGRGWCVSSLHSLTKGPNETSFGTSSLLSSQVARGETSHRGSLKSSLSLSLPHKGKTRARKRTQDKIAHTHTHDKNTHVQTHDHTHERTHTCTHKSEKKTNARTRTNTHARAHTQHAHSKTSTA